MNQLTVAFAAVLLALLPLSSLADEPPQDAAENIVMLKFNGKTVQESAVVIQSADGDIWLDREQWVEMGVVLTPDKLGLLSSRGLGIEPKFDSATQVIDLQVPANLLPGQVFGQGRRQEAPTHAAPKGVMINYDLAGTVSEEGKWAVSAGHDVRVGVASGTLVSTGQLNFKDGKANYIRGLTTWNKDFVEKGVIVQAGDVFTSRSSLANPVNLGGIRVASDRGLRQNEQLTPIPMLGGIAQNSTMADLQINGATVSSHSIKPGPWQLSQYATRPGTNELTLVLTDEFGRDQVVSEQFYVSPGNLVKGATEFDVSVGLIRPDLAKDKYMEPALSAKVEHGLSDQWTLGATVQATKEHRNVALSNRFALGNYGSLSVDLSQSQGPEGQGHAYGLSYDYMGDGWSVRGSHARYSDNHWMLSDTNVHSLIDSRKISSVSSIGFGLSPRGSKWSFGANAVAVDYVGGDSSRRLEAIGRYRRGQDDFALGVSFDAETKDRAIFASWRHSFGPNLAINTNVKAAPEISVGTQLSGRSSIRNHDVRWSAGADYRAAEGSTDAFATATTSTNKGDLTAGVYYTEDNSRVNARWNGSVWLGEGGITTQRATQGSFVLVEVPGQEGVPVSSGGGFESTTNKRGFAMVPDVQPLAAQNIHVNTKDLPLEVGIEETNKLVVAPRLGGAKVVFPITSVQMRELALTYVGKPIEPPAVLTSATEKVSVGRGGVAVLNAPVAGDVLAVRLTDTASCTARLPLNLGTYEQIIELNCEEAK